VTPARRDGLADRIEPVGGGSEGGQPPGAVIVLSRADRDDHLHGSCSARRSPARRFAGFGHLLKTPVIGHLIRKTSVARFTRTLGTLVDAGVPILEAVTITKETAATRCIRAGLSKVHDSIREGDSFAEPLRAAKTCDGIVVNMVDVGEETGELDAMLMKMADNYDEEVESLVGSLISVLEPIMVAVLGVIVGFIVIAMFLPLVKLISSMTG
jgi:type IV pilus assembly protein PilC